MKTYIERLSLRKIGAQGERLPAPEIFEEPMPSN